MDIQQLPTHYHKDKEFITSLNIDSHPDPIQLHEHVQLLYLQYRDYVRCYDNIYAHQIAMRSMRHNFCLWSTDRPEERTEADNMYMTTLINVTRAKRVYDTCSEFYSNIGICLREIEHKINQL
jgi:hypothetical protein